MLGLPRRLSGWDGLQKLSTYSYMCPYCGNQVASDLGYHGGAGADIYVCPMCVHPTYFTEQGVLVPGTAPGEHIANVPADVDQAYEEARDALAAGAPAASVLMSRKLLMHIAVEEGAKEGLHFAEYVNYLADKGFVPPRGRGWVDHIRDKGNEATHEIPQATAADAGELITFLEMLLRFIYDFPSRVPSSSP